MEVDLGRWLVFQDIVLTTLRPDIVLWSKAGKKLIVIELTVLWETRCEEAYERKKAKYTELVDLCRQRWWRTWLFPVEVGVRGFCSQCICRQMTAVGTTGREKRNAIQKLSQTAERASSWLWLRREETSWKHQPTHSDWSPLWAHPLWECSWIKGPKQLMTADSMLMMLVEEQPIYDCIYTCYWMSYTWQTQLRIMCTHIKFQSKLVAQISDVRSVSQTAFVKSLWN